MADSEVSAAAARAGGELLSRLASIESADLAPDKRAALLEAMAGRIDEVLATLLEDATPQPLEAASLEALNLARRLAINASDAQRRAAFAVRGASPLLGSAMHLLAWTVRSSFAAYSKVPRGVWKAMHALYRDAARRGAVRQVEQDYGRSLLLAVADPYRFEPGDVRRIETLLSELEAPLSISEGAPATPHGRHFVLLLDEDAGPTPRRRDLHAASGPGMRVLDTTPLIEALGKRPRDALTSRLLALWENPPKRVFQRDLAQGSVAICVGVKPIAHFVAHDATEDGESETQALRQGITMPLRALPEDEDGRLIPIHEWAVINLSAGGLRVRRRSATAHPLTVGQVVGIRAPGKALWTIGVTRWIVADEDGSTEFGVQYFGQAICAVWLRGVGAPPSRKLGLLVAEGVADGEGGVQESLLAPAETYSSAGIFELRGEGFRSRVKRGTLVEANPRFELFRVEPD